MLRGERPTTPRRWPTICSIFSIFGRLRLRLRCLPWRPWPCAPCPCALPLRRSCGGRCARHDEHDDVLAQDGDGLAVLGHSGVAADDGEIGLAIVDGRRGGRRSAVEDFGLQPDVGLLARELRGDRLHHAGVLAVGRPDGDGQFGRLRRDMIRDRANAAAQQDHQRDHEPGVPQHDLEAAAPPSRAWFRAHGSDRRVGKAEQAAQRNSHGAIVSCSGKPAPWRGPHQGPNEPFRSCYVVSRRSHQVQTAGKAHKWLRN